MNSDIWTIKPNFEEWPSQLSDLEDAPKQLWVRGSANLAVMTKQAVAIVGARAATSYGEEVASELAYGVACKGWTVVSGGAFGIDIAAHRGARHPNNPTVVVLACGVDRAYPAAHGYDFNAIVRSGGLLVSEYPPGSEPTRPRFLERNRLIAALAQGMILAEANVRSGARNAFDHARRLGRHLMVVPGPVTSAQSSGTLAELKKRDTHPVGSAADVIEVLSRC